MAWNVHEIATGRKLTEEESWQRRYQRSWRVWSTSTADKGVGPKFILGQVLAAIGAGGTIGLSYLIPNQESDPFAVVLSTETECVDEDGLGWRVTFQYGPWTGYPKAENPLDQPPVYDMDFARYQRIVDQDTQNNAIVNTAGDRFNPPVQRDDSRPALIVTKNYKDAHIDWALQYRDTVNASGFLGIFPPRTVKLAKIKPTPQFHVNVLPDGQYFQHQFIFDMKEETWDAVVRNQGFIQLVSGVRKQIIVQGMAATEPQPLDSSGAALAVGATPVYLTFEVYQQADWSAFNIG